MGNGLVDRLSYSNLPKGYERTYSNIPPGYERTYGRSYSYVPPPGYERTCNFDPYKRTYGRDPYERTYSNDGYYPSQHDKYPPMKPHYPKYPSPHETPKPTVWKSEKTPKPSAWKKEKTPKPTWHKEEKTPKPTKAEKTPKPTWKKTLRPTKAEKTPKPTWHKDEKTPKPTVWKSDHDKTPKHYSMNDEEQEGGDLQNFGICMLDNYQLCTRVFHTGPNAGCFCKSGCCEGNRCVPKKRDWFGVMYCPSECVGAPGGAHGTCQFFIFEYFYLP